MSAGRLTGRQFGVVALPFILSTVTQPLLGAVDTAVAGHLPDPSFIAGVSIGSVIFNTLYWLLGFLRVGTTGFSAQAGQNKEKALMALKRPLLLAVGGSGILLVLQRPVLQLFLRVLSPEPDVVQHISTYFLILIWGAPFVLMGYVLLGWLMGQGKVRQSLTMQITGNVLNIILDIYFVFHLGLGVAGIAAATLISQITAFAIGYALTARSGMKQILRLGEALGGEGLGSILVTNRDLMLRTVCLLIQINTFTWKGSSFGTAVLAANAVLLQVQGIVSYIFDGLANASSIFSGRACGGKDRGLMQDTLRHTWIWTGAIAGITTGAIALGRAPMIHVLTDLAQVRELAFAYSSWLLLYPAAAAAGLTFYGVFTGASATRAVRDSTFCALLLYLAVWYFAPLYWGNHGLWMAFLAYYLGRTIFLLPKLGGIWRLGGIDGD